MDNETQIVILKALRMLTDNSGMDYYGNVGWEIGKEVEKLEKYTEEKAELKAKAFPSEVPFVVR